MSFTKNQKHHFIPRCYLKQFSENGKYLHVYSKTHKRNKSAQGVRNTAAIKNFYRISLNSIKTEDNSITDANFFETEFFDKVIERSFAPLLTGISEKAKNWQLNKNIDEVLSKKDKDLLAGLIAIQYLRMPNIREKYQKLDENVERARLEIVKSFFGSQYPEHRDFIRSISMTYDRQFDTEKHSEIFANQDCLNNIQDCLLNKFWLFLISPDDDFFTSDNPVLIKPHVQNQPARWEGFDMKGNEVIFPLSSSVLLTLWDTDYFAGKEDEHNKFFLIDAKAKRDYNCYQYIWANDEVYSKKGDFQLIELLKLGNGNTEIFVKKPAFKVYS
jgi:hypothetical protein